MGAGMGFLRWQGARPPWVVCALAAIGAAALGVMIWSFHLIMENDAALKGKESPAGIVSLELAFTAERAEAVLASWGKGRPAAESGIGRALKSLQLDARLILGYSLFGSAVFMLLLMGLGVGVSPFWVCLAALPLAAGAADLGENFLLKKVLDAAEVAPAHIGAAGILAVVKFGLLGFTLVAALAVLCFWLFHRPGKDTAESSGHLVPLADVIGRERVYIRSRRIAAEVEDKGDPAAVGLALSGGGIRSATLCLGVIQSLSRSKLFRCIDYLSTVSGGGYIGSALSSLLSCRRLEKDMVPDDPAQFKFGVADRPHFTADKPEDAPFFDDQRTPLSGHRKWLNGHMVLTHLRAFGDYLVRKRRMLDRDVMRAVGTVLTGIFCTSWLFLNILVIMAGVALLALALTGVNPFSHPIGAGYFAGLARGPGEGTGLGLAVGFGALFTVCTGYLCGLCADKVPDDWFRREGDLREEARQRRALWVLSFISVPAAFAVPPALRFFLPELRDGLLLPAGFFGGGLIGALLSYVVMVCVVPGQPAKRSNPNSRSYISSILGLFFYFLVGAAALSAMAVLLGVMAAGGQGHSSNGAAAGSGGAGLIGGVLLYLTALWRNRRSSDTGSIKKTIGWLQRASETVRKLVLGLAAALVLTAGLMLCMVLVEAFLRWMAITDPGALHYMAVALAAGLLLLVLGLIIDFNKISLHYFYRDRLAEAYLSTVARREGTGRSGHSEMEVRRDHTQMRLLDLHGRPRKDLAHKGAGCGSPGKAPSAAAGTASGGLSFQQYRLRSRFLDRVQVWKTLEPEVRDFAGAATSAPYHLYNACLNLSTDRDAAYRSRKSDIFVFSKLYCGSSVTGYVDTGVYRSGATKVARVMTISGAAMNSAIGRQTFFAQSLGATLFNIRLGQWLENPGYRNGRHAGRQETWIFWPKYLLMEILGMSDSRRRLIHLSDGGHTGDNLGLMSLFQRRCRLILAVDAECDSEMGFGSLMNTLQYAEADLGIKVHLRLDALRPDKRGCVGRHYAAGTILYPPTDSQPEERGHLVVLKSSVHREDDETVHKYRQARTAFPHESTVDQFFSEEQFEAYRKLGENIADQLLREHPELGRGELALR